MGEIYMLRRAPVSETGLGMYIHSFDEHDQQQQALDAH